MVYSGNGMVFVGVNKGEPSYERTKNRAVDELVTALESYEKLLEGTSNSTLKDMYMNNGYIALCQLEKRDHNLGDEKLAYYKKIFS